MAQQGFDAMRNQSLPSIDTGIVSEEPFQPPTKEIEQPKDES